MHFGLMMMVMIGEMMGDEGDNEIKVLMMVIMRSVIQSVRWFRA